MQEWGRVQVIPQLPHHKKIARLCRGCKEKQAEHLLKKQRIRLAFKQVQYILSTDLNKKTYEFLPTNNNFICLSRYFYGTNVNICNCTKGFTGNMCEVPLSDYLPDGEYDDKY